VFLYSFLLPHKNMKQMRHRLVPSVSAPFSSLHCVYTVSLCDASPGAVLYMTLPHAGHASPYGVSSYGAPPGAAADVHHAGYAAPYAAPSVVLLSDGARKELWRLLILEQYVLVRGD
jgi:hypothetical protein